MAWAFASGPLNPGNGGQSFDLTSGAGLRTEVYQPPGSISGLVTSDGGTPLEDICAKAYDSNLELSGYGETGSDGRYLLSGLPSGQYWLKYYDCGDNGVAREFYNNKPDVQSADPVTVASDSVTANVNVQMTVLGTITGTITNTSNTPLPDICANTFDENGRFTGYDRTGADGKYRVGGLATGSYRVRFVDCGQNNYINEYYDNQQDPDLSTTVAVTSGQESSNINAQLARGGSIAGTVTNSSSQNLKDVCVRAYDADGHKIADARTDVSGNYRVIRLVTGTYRLRFTDCGDNNVLTEFYDNKQDLDTANAVSVTSGSDVTGISAQLATGGSISGTITNDVGTQLKDVCVSAESDNYYSDRVRTAPDGTYRIVGLPSGNYRLWFTDCGDNNVLDEYYDNKQSYSQATLVTVTAGSERTGISAQLTRAGSITGAVTDSSNYPLDDICVSAYDSSGFSNWNTKTDSDGTYELRNLTTGDFRVRFDDCGDNNVVGEYYANRQSLSNATRVSVTNGTVTPGINAILSRGGSISGTVTDTSNQPLVGICVRTWDSNGDRGPNGTTDALGHYLIDGLDTDSYRARFVNCGGNDVLSEFYDNQTSLASANRINVERGEPTSGIDAQMARAGSITGVVTNASTMPIGDICVRAYDSHGYSTKETRTAPDGTYALRGFTSGNYRLSFMNCGSSNVVGEFYDDKQSLSSATPISVTAGSTVSNVNAELATGGSISGTVTNSASQLLNRICVRVIDSAGDRVAYLRTGVSGTYSATGLASGNYRIRFLDCGDNNVFGEYYDNQSSLATATQVPVTAGSDSPNIDAQLEAAGSISGIVTNSSGTGLSGVCVEATDSAGDFAGQDYSAAGGSYQIRGLTTDSYRIEFYNCAANNVIREYYDNKTTLASANPVSVTSGVDTPNINAELATAGSISGTVTDSSSQPLDNVCVTAYDSIGSYVQYAYTGNDGAYKLNGLTNGQYRIEFYDCGGHGVLYEYYDDKSSLAAANPVSVTAGSETSNINASLASNSKASISGTVTNNFGQPAWAICVYALDPTYGYTLASDSTDSEGKYKIAGLDPGSYKIRFVDCGSLTVISEYYDNKATLASANTVALSQGQELTGINAELTSILGSISGNVTDSSNLPLPDICVRVLNSSGYLYGEGITDANGNYSVVGLSSGSYRLRFLECGDSGAKGEYFNNKPDLDSATGVQVTAPNNSGGNNAQLDTGDKTPPDTVISSGPSGTVTTGSVTFEFAGSPANDTAKVQCRIDGGAFADCASPKTFSGLSDGPHLAEFRAEDATGNKDQSPASRSFTVDTTPPDTVISSGPSGTVTSSSVSFEFAGSPANDTAKVQCRIDGGAFADCSSPKTFSGLSDGSHTAEFRAEDAAGNQDQTPASRTFTVNVPVAKATIGKVTVKGPAKVKKGKKSTYKVTIANTGNAAATGVKLKVSGKGISASSSPGTIAAGKSKTVRLKIKPKKPGKIKVAFKVTSGNAGGKTTTKTITVKK